MESFVSTGGLRDGSVIESVAKLFDAGISRIELSGGRWNPNLFQELQSWTDRVTFALHHYFPPPAEPFVVNLASPDEVISARSIEHIRSALRWTRDLGSQTYSFHAGYLIDPRPQELGHQLAQRNLGDRQRSTELFLERVHALAQDARRMGVGILIENNVLSDANLKQFGANPLLMTGPEDTAALMSQLPDGVGLLVDVGHLSVSARTLNYRPQDFFSACGRWIGGMHLSDNDGLTDSNQPFTSQSWFWKYVAVQPRFASVEVYGQEPESLKRQCDLADSLLAIRAAAAQ